MTKVKISGLLLAYAVLALAAEAGVFLARKGALYPAVDPFFKMGLLSLVASVYLSKQASQENQAGANIILKTGLALICLLVVGGVIGYVIFVYLFTKYFTF